MKFRTPTQCQNGHDSWLYWEAKAGQIVSLKWEQTCKCPAGEIGEGWSASGPDEIVLSEALTIPVPGDGPPDTSQVDNRVMLVAMLETTLTQVGNLILAHYQMDRRNKELLHVALALGQQRSCYKYARAIAATVIEDLNKDQNLSKY